MTHRELDIRIGREVFGYLVEDDDDGPRYIMAGSLAFKGARLPRYSQDIGAAWKVVAHLAKQGLTVSVVYVASAEAMCVNVDQPHGRRLAEVCEVGGPEIAPLMICRAALATVKIASAGESAS
jgi:hypothetical protein